MANHSSILAWRISLTEEPGGLSYFNEDFCCASKITFSNCSLSPMYYNLYNLQLRNISGKNGLI